MGEYSIHVLEYSYIPEHPKRGRGCMASTTGTLKLPFSYILIRGKDTVALVDVGHNNAEHGAVLTRDYNIQNWHGPDEVLAPFGLTPADVQHVFITHAHFDHMGGIALFPNATFYLQEKELSNWVWTMSLDRRCCRWGRWTPRTSCGRSIWRAWGVWSAPGGRWKTSCRAST